MALRCPAPPSPLAAPRPQRAAEPPRDAGMVLVIGCGESRATLSLTAEIEPACSLITFGGGAVDDHGAPIDQAIAATLTWALDVDRVSRIVLCGHRGCRAFRSDEAGGSRPLSPPPLAAQASRPGSPPSPGDRAAQARLLSQWRALGAAPSTAELVRLGELELIAWWLDDESGAVSQWDPSEQRFALLDPALRRARIDDLRAAPPRPSPT